MELHPFECATCQICLYGITNYQRHANSLEHANKVHLKNLENKTDEDKVQGSSVTSSKNAFDINVGEALSMSPSMNCSYLQCELCQKQFSGSEPYQQHLVSAGHKKKMEISSNPTNLAGLLKCEICDKHFSGPAPYEQHMISNLHKKKVLAMKLKPKSDLFDFDDQSETDNKIDSQNYNLQGNRAQDSFVGIKYHKNVSECDRNEQHSNTVNENLRDSVMLYHSTKSCSLSKNDVNTTSPLICEVCEKTFTGPVPYDQHMSSQIHKKKVQTKTWHNNSLSTDQTDSASINEKKSALCTNSSEKTYEFSNQLPSTGQFRCDLCDKCFTGHIPFDQHVLSANHKKKVQLNSENKSTKDFPMDCKMSPSPWYCQVCDKQCSGAVPFTQHIISDAHCKKTRFAEMQKGLKEMNNLDSVKSPASVNGLSPERQINTDLIYSDLEGLNFIDPDALNVTTFKADENVVFDITLK